MQEHGTGKSIDMQRASIQWNEYRQNWIMIGQEIWGTSLVGEIWFAEAPTPEGPWEDAVKVVTHNRSGETYSFYNPALHPYFDQEGGRYIYFEGTYTAWISSNSDTPTPLYDYNQMMYRLDLSTIPPLTPLGGDYDDDGDVDGTDILVWQRTLGDAVPSGTSADGDGSGVIDAGDLAAWKRRFGRSSGLSAATGGVAVPEPSLLGMLALIALAIQLRQLTTRSTIRNSRGDSAANRAIVDTSAN
jgi:hypothetical protein